MKRKSPRGIPDFSSKKPGHNPFNKIEPGKTQKPVATAPKIKPPSTSSKSGRRGS
jgi:hypothetical protein